MYFDNCERKRHFAKEIDKMQEKIDHMAKKIDKEAPKFEDAVALAKKEGLFVMKEDLKP